MSELIGPNGRPLESAPTKAVANNNVASTLAGDSTPSQVEQGPVVFDVTDATLERDVIERSRSCAVVVDLWASWCGPCRTLGPILEQVITATKGAVVLAKIDVDENPGCSQAFQVRGIPAVYAFKDLHVVDSFTGAQSVDFVQDFVDRLLPNDQELEQKQLLEAGDEHSLRALIEMVPDHVEAISKLAMLLVGSGESEEAILLLERIPATPEVRHLLALARTNTTENSGSGVSIEEELSALLEKVKTDDAARQRFVDLLELMGPNNSDTSMWRSKLASRLN